MSPPNKSKTQLQLCLHEGKGEPATFAFVNPNGGQEAHVKDRDLVKDTLQQLLLKYRAVANAEAKKANQQQAVGGHLQQKERLLSENPRLQALYRDLVTTNLISPKEFWAEYVDKVMIRSIRIFTFTKLYALFHKYCLYELHCNFPLMRVSLL